MLHDICALVLSPMLSVEQAAYLRLLVQEYLTSYTALYDMQLTPKFHFLVHLPRMIIRSVTITVNGMLIYIIMQCCV